MAYRFTELLTQHYRMRQRHIAPYQASLLRALSQSGSEGALSDLWVGESRLRALLAGSKPTVKEAQNLGNMLQLRHRRNDGGEETDGEIGNARYQEFVGAAKDWQRARDQLARGSGSTRAHRCTDWEALRSRAVERGDRLAEAVISLIASYHYDEENRIFVLKEHRPADQEYYPPAADLLARRSSNTSSFFSPSALKSICEGGLGIQLDRRKEADRRVVEGLCLVLDVPQQREALLELVEAKYARQAGEENVPRSAPSGLRRG